MNDKFCTYNHSIASILRGFDEWAEKEIEASGGLRFPQVQFEKGVCAALKDSRNKLIELADAAQREIDECKAGERV